MNIPEIKDNIKSSVGSKNGQNVLFITLLIVSNILSFKIGQNSLIYPETTNYSGLETKADYSLKDADLKPGSLALAIQSGQKIDQSGEVGMGNTPSSNTGEIPPRYVASKSGRVYYFTWCTGAKRILEENRQYFNSSSDARAAGLSPSTACPDLD